MKSCLNCGTEAQGKTETCTTCGRDFAFLGAEPTVRVDDRAIVFTGAQPKTVLPSGAVIERPDGSSMIPLGSALLGGGIILAIIGAMIDPTDYSGIDPDKVLLRWNLVLGGGGIAQVGFFLVLTGYILRAISFLPGRK